MHEVVGISKDRTNKITITDFFIFKLSFFNVYSGSPISVTAIDVIILPIPRFDYINRDYTYIIFIKIVGYTLKNGNMILPRSGFNCNRVLDLFAYLAVFKFFIRGNAIICRLGIRNYFSAYKLDKIL